MATTWFTPPPAGKYRKGIWHGLPIRDNAGGKYVTSAYGAHEDFRKALGWGPHGGCDLGATPIGTHVDHAGRRGTVTHTGRSGMYAAAGEYVRVDLGDGYDIGYAHLSRIDVEVGDVVEVGDPIGLSGNTTSGGGSTAPHLHITVRKNHNPIDPIPFFETMASIEDDAPLVVFPLDQQTAMEWFTSEYYLKRGSFGGTKSQAEPEFIGYDEDGKTEQCVIRLLRPNEERPL